MSLVPQASLMFPGGLASVSQARHFAASTLAAWDLDGYDLSALVVVTELAANAALHTGSGFVVRLRSDAAHLVVEVEDELPDPPRRRSFSPEATTGRGLLLVEALCRSWGVASQRDGAGKVVWAHVLPDRRSDHAGLFADVDAGTDLDMDGRLGLPAQSGVDAVAADLPVDQTVPDGELAPDEPT